MRSAPPIRPDQVVGERGGGERPEASTHSISPSIRGKWTAHHAAVTEGRGVASRSPAWRVRPRRSGRTGSRGCRAERRPDSGGAGLWSANATETASPHARSSGVVDLVEDHERPAGDVADLAGALRDLLVRGDEAVHVGRKTTLAGHPRALEDQAEGLGGVGPLALKVLGRRHDDHPSRLALNGLTGRREREGGLARARCGDGEEVRGGPLGEAVEGISLPASESKRSGHVNGPR